MALTFVMMVVMLMLMVMVVIVWLAAGHAIEQAAGAAGRRPRKNERARVGGALAGQRAVKRWRSGTTDQARPDLRAGGSSHETSALSSTVVAVDGSS
jgi:hypothetical protein